MYTVLHRFISLQFKNFFLNEVNSDPRLSTVEWIKNYSLDLLQHEDTFYKLGFQRFKNSDLFGVNTVLANYNYVYFKKYYEENKDKFVYCKDKNEFVKSALMPYERYTGDLAKYITVYSVDEIEKLREYVYKILDNGKIEPYSETYKEMFFYTILVGLFPELFMGTTLQYYTLGNPITVVQNLNPRNLKNSNIPANTVDHLVFRSTATAIAVRLRDIIYSNDNEMRIMTQNLVVYPHAIYRLHLVNSILLAGLNHNLVRSDGILKRAVDVFKKYVVKKLAEKYSFAIERLVKYHNLDYVNIQYMVLQDIIDYLQLLGLTLSYIGIVPDITVRNTLPKDKKDLVSVVAKYDINLWDFHSKFVDKLDDPAEFYVDFFKRVFDYNISAEQLRTPKFFTGIIFRSSKSAGFHLLLNDCFLPAPEGDLDFCRYLTIPREMLETYVQKFEAGILYSMNSIFLPDYDDFTKLLHDDVPTVVREKKMYPTTYPLMTPYAIMFIDTVINGMFMFNGYKEKYPDLWDKIVCKGEYLKDELNSYLRRWIQPSNLKSFVPPPPNLIGMDSVLLNDYVKAVLNTNYDKISEDGKQEFYVFFEDLLLIPRYNRVAEYIHLKYDPENFVDPYLDYIYLNPISCGVVPTGREEKIKEREQKLQQKRANITDSMKDSLDTDKPLGIEIDMEKIKSISKQVEIETTPLGKKVSERYNLDYYNLETIISDDIQKLNESQHSTNKDQIEENNQTTTEVQEEVASDKTTTEQTVEETVSDTIDLVESKQEEVISDKVVQEEEDMSTIVNVVERHDNELSQLRETIKDITSSLEKMRTNIDKMGEKLEQVVNSLQQLGIKVGDHEIRISTVENEIDRLRNRVEIVEKEIQKEKKDIQPEDSSANSTNAVESSQQPITTTGTTIVYGHSINLAGASVQGNVVINIGSDTNSQKEDRSTDESKVSEVCDSSVDKQEIDYNSLVEDVTNRVTERIISELDKAVTKRLVSKESNDNTDEIVSKVVEKLKDMITDKSELEEQFKFINISLEGYQRKLDEHSSKIKQLEQMISKNQTEQKESAVIEKKSDKVSTTDTKISNDLVTNNSEFNILDGFITSQNTTSSDPTMKLDQIFNNLDAGIEKTMKIISEAESDGSLGEDSVFRDTI